MFAKWISLKNQCTCSLQRLISMTIRTTGSKPRTCVLTVLRNRPWAGTGMMEGGALPPSPAGKPACLSAVTLPASIRGHSRQPRVPRTKPVKTSREASQFQTWCEDSCHLGNQKRCLFLGLRAVQTFPGPTPSDAQFLLTVPHGHIVPQEILSEVQMARLPLSALVLNPRFPLLGFLQGLASKPSCVANGGCETPSSWCLQRLLLSRTRVCRQGPECRMPRRTERMGLAHSLESLSSPQAERMRNLTTVSRPGEPKAAAKEGRRKKTCVCDPGLSRSLPGLSSLLCKMGTVIVMS